MVTSRKLSQLFLLGIFLFLQCTIARSARLEAQWVLYNGKILTADTEDPGSFTIAQAVAIYDGKFVVVGSNQDALDTAGPSTRRVDLAGKTVLPGLIETHLHVHTQALSHHARGVVDIEPSLVSWSSKEQGLAQVRSVAVQKRPGEWVAAVVVGRSRLDSMVSGMSIANGNSLTPTLAELPLPLGTLDPEPDNPLAGLFRAGKFVPFTPLCNMTGQPAMSVPLGQSKDGLPIGCHFIGRFGDEATLFRLAAQLEQARPWADRRPAVHACAASR